MKRNFRNIVIALALAASGAGAGCQGKSATPYFVPNDTDTEDTEDTSTSDSDSDTDGDTDTSTEDTDTATEDTDTTDTEDTDTATTDTETEDTDTATEEDPNCPTVAGQLDSVTGLCWQVAPAEDELSRNAAISYCQDLSLGGWDDWFLPAKNDWVMILDSCDIGATDYPNPNGYCNSCAASTKCFQLLGYFGTGYHWTSNYLTSGANGVFVNLTSGQVSTDSIISEFRVRCVRQAY